MKRPFWMPYGVMLTVSGAMLWLSVPAQGLLLNPLWVMIPIPLVVGAWALWRMSRTQYVDMEEDSRGAVVMLCAGVIIAVLGVHFGRGTGWETAALIVAAVISLAAVLVSSPAPRHIILHIIGLTPVAPLLWLGNYPLSDNGDMDKALYAFLFQLIFCLIGWRTPTGEARPTTSPGT